MEYTHCCVIDVSNFYKTFVLVLNRLKQGEDGSVTAVAEVQYYALLPGETLIETGPPTMRLHAGAEGFLKPMWDAKNTKWIEGATAEQISDWETEHPAPKEPEDPMPPSGDLEGRVAALEAAQASAWSEQAAAIREGVNSVE